MAIKRKWVFTEHNDHSMVVLVPNCEPSNIIVVDAIKLILLIYNNFSIVKIVVNIIERVK